VLLFFRDNAPAPHESSGSFVLFPLNTTPTTGPSAAPDLQHGLCKYSTRSCPHHMRDQMHLKVSEFLMRGRNGPLNGHMAAADVAVWRSVLRGWMNMVWIQLLLFQSQLEESKNVLTVT